ncbi:MAG TPA: YCF48-related protein, partial [Ignavibacteriaceae bacterium]|nr:YCF48-related protein [Ignavibacteriaceae bacterium]
MKIYFCLIISFLSFYSNLTAQWFVQESGTTDLLYGIKFVDNNNGWVTNLYGTKLFHTTNGGADWFVQKDFGTQAIWNFTFINNSIGYIYSHGGPAHLLKTTDGGTTWETIHTFSSTVDDIKFYDENTGWCVESELTGYLSKTTNGGLDWQGIDYFNSHAVGLGKVGIINANTVIVTGFDTSANNAIFKTTDGGISWTEIPVTEGLIGGRIQFIDENIGWIESFGLYKTTDGGYNWEMQVPSLYDFFFINENLGWYINNNQIYRSTDGGQSWESQNSGTNNTLYTLFFIDQNNGWVSGDIGTILYTPNGGTPVEFISFTSSVSGNSVNL